MPQQNVEELRAAVLRKRVEEKRAQEMSTVDDAPKKREFTDISPLATAVVKGTQGLTGGFADEIGAAIVAAPYLMPGGKSFGDVYDSQVGRHRAFLKQAEEQNPTTSVASEIGGAIASPINKIAAPIAGAGTAANLGRAALGGATIAAGTSETNPFLSGDNLGEFASDVAGGAAGGFATQGALGIAGKAAGKLAPESLKQFARERAVKAATGQNKKLLKQASKLGQLERIGGDLIDGAEEFGIKAPVSFGASVDTIKNRAAEGSRKAWRAVEDIYKNIDERTGGAAVDTVDIAQNILNRAKQIEPTPQNMPIIQRLRAEADWLAEEAGAISLDRAQSLKNQYVFKMADPKTHALGKDGSNQIRSAYTDAIKNTILKKGSNSDLKKYERALEVYGSMTSAAGAADERAVANLSNRWASPSDYGIGIATALGSTLASGGANLGALAAGGAASMGHKFLRERGSGMAAAAANKLAGPMSSEPARMVIGGAQKLSQTPASNAFMQYVQSKGDGT